MLVSTPDILNSVYLQFEFFVFLFHIYWLHLYTWLQLLLPTMTRSPKSRHMEIIFLFFYI